MIFSSDLICISPKRLCWKNTFLRQLKFLEHLHLLQCLFLRLAIHWGSCRKCGSRFISNEWCYVSFRRTLMRFLQIRLTTWVNNRAVESESRSRSRKDFQPEESESESKKILKTPTPGRPFAHQLWLFVPQTSHLAI